MSDDLTAVYLLGAYDASREWRDAAEFEARVAAWLANPSNGVLDCIHCPTHRDVSTCGHDDVASCRMLWARLAVEDEMDG